MRAVLLVFASGCDLKRCGCPLCPVSFGVQARFCSKYALNAVAACCACRPLWGQARFRGSCALNTAAACCACRSLWCVGVEDAGNHAWRRLCGAAGANLQCPSPTQPTHTHPTQKKWTQPCRCSTDFGLRSTGVVAMRTPTSHAFATGLRLAHILPVKGPAAKCRASATRICPKALEMLPRQNAMPATPCLEGTARRLIIESPCRSWGMHSSVVGCQGLIHAPVRSPAEGMCCSAMLLERAQVCHQLVGFTGWSRPGALRARMVTARSPSV